MRETGVEEVQKMMEQQEVRGNSLTLKSSDEYSSGQEGRRHGRGGEEMMEKEEKEKDRWRRL